MAKASCHILGEHRSCSQDHLPSAMVKSYVKPGGIRMSELGMEIGRPGQAWVGTSYLSC
jgi:hypothetical protein